MIREAKMRWPSALPVMVQLLATWALSLIFSLLAFEQQSKTPLNLVWMAGAPLAIGYAFNKGIRRIMMLILLPIASLSGIGIAAALIGYP